MSNNCCQVCYGDAPNCFAGDTACTNRSQDNTCRSTFDKNCVNIPASKYYENWTNSDYYCETMITNNILSGGDGVQWASSEMYTIFEKFYSFNGMKFIIETDELDPSYLQFQNYLQGVCLRNPAACSSGLESLCSQYTRDDLIIYPGLIQMCGCNLPEEEYSKYENLYGLPKSCDPICARTDVVQATQITGDPQKCPGTICIIDDVNVNITDSKTGNFNFNQTCGGCYGTTTCKCIVSGVSVDVVNSKIGNVDISEKCTGSVDCYQQNPYDPKAPAIKVSCDQQASNTVTTKDVYIERYSQTSESGIPYSYILITSIAIFFIIIGCMAYLIVRASERKDREITVYDKKSIEKNVQGESEITIEQTRSFS